jgi:CHAT domain-containing protein
MINSRLKSAWLAAIIVILAGLQVSQAQTDDRRSAALEDIRRGTEAFRKGDFEAAMRDWSNAIRICRQIGASDIEAQALSRRGEAYRIQGDFRDAKRDLEAALAKADGNQALMAASSGALGNLEFLSRDNSSAEIHLKRSRDLASRLRDFKTLAAADNDLGNLYVARGKEWWVEARIAYEEAIRNAEETADQTLVATAEINAARLALAGHDAASAASLLSSAVERLERSPLSYKQGMALLSAGSSVFTSLSAESSMVECSGNIPLQLEKIARLAFQLAAQTADMLHNATLSSFARGDLGRLYECTGRRDEAASLTQRAALAAKQTSSADLGYRWEWQQGSLADAEGRSDDAIHSYRAAIFQLELIRQDIPVEYLKGRSSYRVNFGPLYLRFSDLVLRRAATDRDNAVTLRKEAQDTVELLKEHELADYFHQPCLPVSEEKKQQIENVGPGTAILYPISLPDRLEILVSFGSQEPLQQFTFGISQISLREEVTRFRLLLEKRWTNEYLVPARQLYDQIIRQVEPTLAEHRVDTLVVVPDDVLRIVPFGAFYDGNRFLVDRYATAIAPSLSFVEQPRHLNPGAGTALVLGISQSVQDYIDLPNVQQEVAGVHAIEGGDVLLNDGFTRARFASDLKSGRYNIVHIASHGQFKTDSSQSFVLAFDGPLRLNELATDIRRGRGRASPLELLILSACETASGDDSAALGLAGVAFEAGARSALATLWYINDLASGELVVDFYKGLQSGLSRAQALRKAQLELKRDPRFDHPAYWAPFLLIGNWL